jgi:hypothetical protein
MSYSSYDKKYPVFKFRISHAQLAWLRDYAKRHGVSIAQVVKNCLVDLQRQQDKRNEVADNVSTGSK